MEVTTKALRRCDVVTVKGRIDSETAPNLGQALGAIKDAGRYNIALNLKEVSFMSSAGLSQLIETQNTCKRLNRGELVLVEVPPRVKEVLDLAGLTPLFKQFDSELEAVGSF
jgi:anti-sigma B factor antagonist